MRNQFRAELINGQFKPIGESWKRWKLNAKPGTYMFSPRKEGLPRKLNQNNLYWLRNEVLCSQPEIDISKDGLHEWLMVESGYGVKKEFKGRSIFDRESSTQLTVEEFSRLMQEQDKLAIFCNEGRDPEHYIELPTS